MKENTSKNGKRHGGRRYSAQAIKNGSKQEVCLKLSGQTGSKIIDSMDRLLRQKQRPCFRKLPI